MECQHEKAVVILDTGGQTPATQMRIGRCQCGAVVMWRVDGSLQVLAEPLPRDAQGDFPSIRMARLEREAKTDSLYARQVMAQEQHSAALALDVHSKWEHESERWREVRDEERRKIAVWQSLADGLRLVAFAGVALAAIGLAALIVAARS